MAKTGEVVVFEGGLDAKLNNLPITVEFRRMLNPEPLNVEMVIKKEAGEWIRCVKVEAPEDEPLFAKTDCDSFIVINMHTGDSNTYHVHNDKITVERLSPVRFKSDAVKFVSRKPSINAIMALDEWTTGKPSVTDDNYLCYVMEHHVTKVKIKVFTKMTANVFARRVVNWELDPKTLPAYRRWLRESDQKENNQMNPSPSRH